MRFMETKFTMTPPDPKIISQLRQALSCSSIMANLLANRGICTGEQARRFLTASIADLPAPETIADIQAAVERIGRAINNKEKIMIVGDYDADGVTATAVLTNFLRYTETVIKPYIPHRVLEGYGLKPEHITKIAVPEQIDLILTVDCGASNHEAADACRQAGIDLIITDHHQIKPPYPDALAVINPSRPDCPSGLADLAGVGVAFYLVIALRQHLRNNNFWQNLPEPNLKNLCDLVAIGTIADIVPLTGVNRILVKTGLDLLNVGDRPGISALKTATKFKQPRWTTEDVAFKLAPRLNAPGRIDHARVALDLLLNNDPKSARKTADTLNKLNSRRQFIEQDIADDIIRIVGPDSNISQQKQSLVLARPGWHQGVIGIAASRAVRRYGLPVALIAVNGDVGVGSARSLTGLNLYACLQECGHLFEDFGGHSQAAGFRMKAAHIPRFEKEFEYAVKRVTAKAPVVAETMIDCELQFTDINDPLFKEIEQLQPFGEKNPEPLFITKNIQVASSFLIKNQHRKMALTQPTVAPNKKINAICFNIPSQLYKTKHFSRILYRLRRDTWNGNQAPQLIIEKLYTEGVKAKEDPYAGI